MAIYVDGTKQTGSGGGGTGGGHVFLDNEGTAMPQRAKAKFEGAYSTDNSADGITNVAVMRTMNALEYAQLTEAEKQGMIYVDDETTGTDDKFQPVIYSLEEREIGVWTDGKPLYEKTIAITAPSSDETTINHNISNADYIYVKEGTLTKTGNGTTPYETYHSSSVWACGVYNVSRTSFVLFVGSSLRPFVNGGFITFRYTKTTDTAGSGQWTPQGVPAIHYSTDEQVIGTWIDGKTLYERFVTIPNISIASGSGDWRYKDIIITSYMSDVNIDYIALNVDASYYEVGNDTYSFLGARCSQSDKEIVLCTLFSVNSATAHLCVRYTKASS